MKILQLAIGLPITVCQIATKAANLVARFFFLVWKNKMFAAWAWGTILLRINIHVEPFEQNDLITN